jgi:hypothetical protein
VVQAGGAASCVVCRSRRRHAGRLEFQRVAVCVSLLGRKVNTIGDSTRYLVTGLPACNAQEIRRGARRGASGRRCRTILSDVGRLKLLVEPHPATLRNNKALYGMQEVRGSNHLSSTAQSNISNSRTVAILVPGSKPDWKGSPKSRSGHRSSQALARLSGARAARLGLRGWHAGWRGH